MYNMDKIDELEKKIELMNTEIESLIVNGDIIALITEALDNIGVIIYKLYEEMKKINEV